MNREEHLSTADFVATGGRTERNDDRERETEYQHTGPMGGAAMEPAPGPLFPQDAINDLRARWDSIQTGFVDEPRASVQKADELVASAMKHLAESFAGERNKLEKQWDRGGEVNTEDLRVALRKYRSFFQRLLTV
jgi:hypothetical protein